MREKVIKLAKKCGENGKWKCEGRMERRMGGGSVREGYERLITMPVREERDIVKRKNVV